MAQTQYSAFVESTSDYLYSASTCVLEHQGVLYGMGDGGNFSNLYVWRSDNLGTNWAYVGQWPSGSGMYGRQGDNWRSYQGSIHVFGGWRGYAMRDHWKSPDGVTWTQVTSDMGWGAHGFCSSVFDDGTGEKLWVYTGAPGYPNDTWTFDGVSWVQVANTSPNPNGWNPSMAALDGNLYLFRPCTYPGTSPQSVMVWGGGQWNDITSRYPNLLMRNLAPAVPLGGRIFFGLGNNWTGADPREYTTLDAMGSDDVSVSPLNGCYSGWGPWYAACTKVGDRAVFCFPLASSGRFVSYIQTLYPDPARRIDRLREGNVYGVRR